MDSRENAVEWITGDDRIVVSLTQRKFISKVKSLADKFPDEVSLVENLDGSICANLPLNYLKISHPRQMSDEQKRAAANRMAQISQMGRNVARERKANE